MMSSVHAFARRATGARGSFVRWEGHDLVVLENRHLRVCVSCSRGAEIVELRDKRTDVDVLWHAERDVVANRGGRPTVNRAEGNFLDHFGGGWQEVFPSGGDACEYRGAQLGQHGEVALLPWDAVIEEDTAARVSVRFSVACRRLPLTLERRLTIEDDSATLRWEGRARNHAPVDVHVMWGQHLALGPPFAAPGAELELPAGARCELPASDSPTRRFGEGVTRWPELRDRDGRPTTLTTLPPTDGSEGHVFLSELPAATATVRNRALDLAARFDWDGDAFPHVWCWGVFGGNRAYPLWGRHYLLTIEPFTSPYVTLAEAAERGLAPLVPAHGTLDAWLEWTFTAA